MRKLKVFYENKFSNRRVNLFGMKRLGLVYALSTAFVISTILQGCKKEPIIKNEVISASKFPKTTDVLTNSENSYIINFSGYDWIVTNSPSTTRGPGNNYWSANNVWVDANGYLHLKLAKNTTTGKWECAEIKSVNSFGMGTYQFSVEGRVDKLNQNVVFGLFNYSGLDYYDEMDIEFARWGKKSNPNLSSTLYPAEGSVGTPWSSSTEFTLNGSYSTYRFTRTATSVLFQGLHGFTNTNENAFFSKTCIANFISLKTMPIYMNLWLFKGQVPTDKKTTEIIIQRFSFTP